MRGRARARQGRSTPWRCSSMLTTLRSSFTIPRTLSWLLWIRASPTTRPLRIIFVQSSRTSRAMWLCIFPPTPSLLPATRPWEPFSRAPATGPPSPRPSSPPRAPTSPPSPTPARAPCTSSAAWTRAATSSTPSWSTTPSPTSTRPLRPCPPRATATARRLSMARCTWRAASAASRRPTLTPLPPCPPTCTISRPTPGRQVWRRPRRPTATPAWPRRGASCTCWAGTASSTAT
mmetsp:Transcript_55020/g.174967  ORF Transcript_55020/g.174967 Transcript_55020/m.174967 type:complete len:233 (-) Transcript_55020:152-850(-)